MIVFVNTISYISSEYLFVHNNLPYFNNPKIDFANAPSSLYFIGNVTVICIVSVSGIDAVILPLWASTMDFAMDNPNP